eukprot:7114734-Prymnesium_polylepis.1
MIEQTLELQASDPCAVNETVLRLELAALYDVSVEVVVLSAAEEPASNDRMLRRSLQECLDVGVDTPEECLEAAGFRPKGARRLTTTMTYLVQMNTDYLVHLLYNATSNAANAVEAVWSDSGGADRVASALGGGVIVQEAPVRSVIKTVNTTISFQRYEKVDCPPGNWGADGRCVACTPG